MVGKELRKRPAYGQESQQSDIKIVEGAKLESKAGVYIVISGTCHIDFRKNSDANYLEEQIESLASTCRNMVYLRRKQPNISLSRGSKAFWHQIDNNGKDVVQ